MMEEIKKKVLERNWTFNDISNLKVTVTSLAKDIYSEMTLIEKFKTISEVRIKEDYVGLYFEDVMRETVLTTLNGEVAEIIKNMLDTATIEFKGNNNEISERSMGGEPHKKRSANEKKDSKNEE
tara:strand:- start:240 stop:611 length:372 start_codon:yes stop_codon:yes gene_type:complete